jgi:hypothetical protein
VGTTACTGPSATVGIPVNVATVDARIVAGGPGGSGDPVPVSTGTSEAKIARWRGQASFPRARTRYRAWDVRSPSQWGQMSPSFPYGSHYRKMLPPVLQALRFRCNNTAHRPLMDALELLRRYAHRERIELLWV